MSLYMENLRYTALLSLLYLVLVSDVSTSVLSVGTLPCQDYFVGWLMCKLRNFLLMSVLCLMQRNDMVEYFGEQLEGFCFSANGWVQSYGSRCVKPPIIFGDVSRPKAMTVFWSQYAQSVTKRPMKGMLTGPVTILNWSFVRNDQPRYVKSSPVSLQ
jgi:hypothetical protein